MVLAMLLVGCGGASVEVYADADPLLGGPTDPRFDHSAVWTGDEVLIVGGAGGDLTDGLLVDDSLSWSETNGFATVPSAPEPVVARHAAVWTGTEMIIWSGSTRPYGVGDGLVTVASAFDPAAETWRQLTPSPEPLGRVFGRSAVADDHAVFVAGATPLIDDAGRIAVYDIVADEWSETGVAGVSFDVVSFGDDVWILSIDDDQPRVWQFDPTKRSLHELPRLNFGEPAAQGALAVRDEELFLWVDGVTQPLGLFRLIDSSDAESRWQQVGIEPGELSNATYSGELLRPLVVVDDWLVTVENEHLRWIDPETGRDVNQLLTSEQRCALGLRPIAIDGMVFGWNGSTCTIDGETFQGGFIFRPPRNG